MSFENLKSKNDYQQGLGDIRRKKAKYLYFRLLFWGF
jgi:hypothetical protein